MIVLDSNMVIYLSKGLVDLSDLPSDDDYCVSIITYMEVMGYAFATEQEKRAVSLLFESFTILPLDKSIANQVIKLRQSNKIKLPDAIICATAMSHDAILVSNDVRLNKVDQLHVYQVGY
jgi:predicted nucleic acid-binding protein